VTQLALRCVALEVAADPGRLFYGDDPLYELWLIALCDRVEGMRREQQKESKSK
jgi:hypothetical protein